MAKFALECPKCGTINTASNFIFSKKTIKCSTCANEINVKESKLISKTCPHCHNTLVFDQSKKNQTCPVCGKPIDHLTANTASYKMVTVNCPQCACAIEVDKTATNPFCPICDYQLDLQKELNKAKLVNDTGVSVIQYEGDNSTFIWKHPIEDFNLGSQLVVHESQEAIFFCEGEALDTFGPGRHALETANLPILKKIYDLPTGKQTPFHAEVYFINKTVHMGLKWGTDSRVRFIDPITGIPLDIGACGELNLQVENGRKLLVKLVGTTGGIGDRTILSAGSDSSDRIHTTLKSYFRAPLMSEVKSHLAAVIKDMKINILEIDQYMATLSDSLRERISPKFEEYGLTIPNFYITNIDLPESDKNFQEIKSLISQAYLRIQREELEANVAEAERKKLLTRQETEARLQMIRAQGEAEAMRATGMAEAEIMRAKGYSQKDVLEADVQKAYAAGMGQMGSNGGGGGGGGGVGTDLVGMMAQMKMASTMFDKMDIMSTGSSPNQAAPATAPAADTWTCACGENGNTKNFCMNCGKPKPELWTCACGHSGNKGAFCEMCGAPKAPATWECPKCGEKDNKGKFCAGCGAKKDGDE
ncbi:MAG: SPFH domain-containing protein [Clostridia bacterium]|nr:SPFH domain-containing protein [Clostridia bacterium]